MTAPSARQPTRLWAVFILLAAGTVPVAAKECRILDVPPGLQVRMPTGCKAPGKARDAKADPQTRLKGENGFVDLGNGTQIRVGGQVRGEAGFRR